MQFEIQILLSQLVVRPFSPFPLHILPKSMIYIFVHKGKIEINLSIMYTRREELVHGFILVYSSRRKASIATLRYPNMKGNLSSKRFILSAFSMNIPELPIQIVAVTDSSTGNFHQTAELNQILVAEVSFCDARCSKLNTSETYFRGITSRIS